MHCILTRLAFTICLELGDVRPKMFLLKIDPVFIHCIRVSEKNVEITIFSLARIKLCYAFFIELSKIEIQSS